MLVLTGPGYAPRLVNDDIDMIDLAPTLAKLLDFPATGFQGQPQEALAPATD